MQKQAIFVIVILLIITGVGSYLLGSKLTQSKPRLIYVPTTKKAAAPSSASFLAKGSLIITTGGIIKSVSPDSISIGDNNNEATFKIDNSTTIFKKADNNNKTSTQSGKIKGFSGPEEKTTIDSVKTGQTVSLNVEISEKQAIVRNIRIVNE